MVDLVLERLKSEPALVVGALVALLVLTAGHFGIVLDEASVTEVLTPLVAGLLTRRFVVPNAKHEELKTALPAQDDE